MTFQQFIDKYLGKKIDFDGFYGGQCVDLYRQYIKEVLGFPQSPGVGGAAEIWDSASPEYYDFIINTPTGVPTNGDIVIWNRRAGGGFGHVAIFIGGDINRFTSFDQNWPTIDVCTITEHTYTNVIGWMHPKEVAEECLVPNTPEWKAKYDELVSKATKYDSIKEAGYETIDSIKLKIETMQKNIDALDKTTGSLNQLIIEKNATIAKQTTQISTADGQLQELAVRIVKLEEQTSVIPTLEKENEYLTQAKEDWIEAEKTYNRTVAQLRSDNEELRSGAPKILIGVILEKFKNKLNNFVDYIKGYKPKGGENK